MILSLLITILLSSLLFACTSEGIKDDKSEERATSIGIIEEIKDDKSEVRANFIGTIEETKEDKSEVRATFIGTIEEINDYYAQVLVIESERINQMSGLINVDFSVNPDETFQVGDKVKVGYDANKVREIDPVQIVTLTLEKVE
jgi:hypothetical protein